MQGGGDGQGIEPDVERPVPVGESDADAEPAGGLADTVLDDGVDGLTTAEP